MLEYLSYDENGKKTVCEMNGFHAEMGLTIWVQKLPAGASVTICDPANETAALLLSGEAEFAWGGNRATGKRRDPFERLPYALHVCKNTQITVTAQTDSEVLFQQTDNDRIFDPVFYTPETCLYQEFGKGQWGGAGHRIVSTMFDYDNAPYSNMVMGEVFTQPGKWSSYPPHHHPQPEVYYYMFDKPQGFGACFNGENAYKSTHGSACYIQPGDDHQQAAAPGYEMYYVWMIRHIDGDPWYKTTRFVAPAHEWLTKE
ncbi:MAG: 5-deoxy-glucuronate isomerase [Clostridia bacterium]|nr:5-deoxy-glucuronate isomerase [Clostridia bacterium]